jgi:type II secretory pathway pseudopilin PulG
VSMYLRQRRAFTIVEVTVGAALAAVISGATFLILHNSTKVNQKVENKTEAIQSANLALECIKRDLRQLVVRPFVAPGTPNTGVIGDPQHPVLISADGQQMSFYIPDPASPAPDPTTGRFKLTPVYYGVIPEQPKPGKPEPIVHHMIRVEGNNPNLLVDAANRAVGNVNIGAIYLRDGKDQAGNLGLPPIQFKLLGPNPNPAAGAPSAPSGDKNYYLQITLFGADGEGQEEQARTDLTVLEVPSQLAAVAGARANDLLLFDPNPPVLFIAGPPPPITGLPINPGTTADPGTTPITPPTPTPAPVPSTPPSSPPPPVPVVPTTTPSHRRR